MPKNPTVYQRKWESQFDADGMEYKKWLKRHDDQNAWCEPCQTIIKVETMGKSAIRQHSKLKKHKNDVQYVKCFGIKIFHIFFLSSFVLTVY